jgi:hypothetical protein
MELMRRDKKAHDGRVQFVLLRAIGEPVLCDAVAEAEIALDLTPHPPSRSGKGGLPSPRRGGAGGEVKSSTCI